MLEAMDDVPPGLYDFPHMSSMDELKTPETRERFERGPVGFFIVAPRGMRKMGKNLSHLVRLFGVRGCSSSRTSRATRCRPAGVYLVVFRVTGTVAWAAYGLSHVSEAVWFARPWS